MQNNNYNYYFCKKESLHLGAFIAFSSIHLSPRGSRAASSSVTSLVCRGKVAHDRDALPPVCVILGNASGIGIATSKIDWMAGCLKLPLDFFGGHATAVNVSHLEEHAMVAGADEFHHAVHVFFVVVLSVAVCFRFHVSKWRQRVALGRCPRHRAKIFFSRSSTRPFESQAREGRLDKMHFKFLIEFL